MDTKDDQTTPHESRHIIILIQEQISNRSQTGHHIERRHAKNKKNITVTQIYRLNIAPEQSKKGQIYDIAVEWFEAEIAAAWKIPADTKKTDTKALKLILKGSPYTSSYRYGHGQFRKCAKEKGRSRFE